MVLQVQQDHIELCLEERIFFILLQYFLYALVLQLIRHISEQSLRFIAYFRPLEAWRLVLESLCFAGLPFVCSPVFSWLALIKHWYILYTDTPSNKLRLNFKSLPFLFLRHQRLPPQSLSICRYYFSLIWGFYLCRRYRDIGIIDGRNMVHVGTACHLNLLVVYNSSESLISQIVGYHLPFQTVWEIISYSIKQGLLLLSNEW